LENKVFDIIDTRCNHVVCIISVVVDDFYFTSYCELFFALDGAGYVKKKRRFEWSRCKWSEYIKMVVSEIGRETVGWYIWLKGVTSGGLCCEYCGNEPSGYTNRRTFLALL